MYDVIFLFLLNNYTATGPCIKLDLTCIYKTAGPENW